jgi:hypothetical protein
MGHPSFVREPGVIRPMTSTDNLGIDYSERIGSRTSSVFGPNFL